ncbi:glycerophosphodiester phosphodiesterase domain-containing protein 4 isoform X3 [Mastomys coucha]|uniref:glycerophosphodiester phosphodiesterase domain-containing protein 4 isoform X3 n=1 Tax=Mastomys coucha TaxID=35658 RepID=UPI00126145D4|nr:glycerophosphodiester phosphodiesterase domain-containing protein 4 isoform X3 [Mastomys coucha]
MEEIQAAPSSKPENTNENSNPWIEQYFNHKCCITFLTGCYSCQWQYRKWEKTELGSCCCSRKEQFFYVCLVIAFLVTVLFLFIWVETSNEYNGFDWVVYLGTGRWFLWSILVLSAGVIMVAYTSLLLLIGFLLLWERIELNLHTSHKVFILLIIFLCSFLIGVLSYFWKDKWLIAGLSVQIFAPFVHLSLITVMIIVSWPLAICVARLESEVKIRRYRMTDYEQEVLQRCNVFQRLRALQLAAGLSFLIVLLCLYLMPLGIYSPCVLKKENLGPKPTLFGHRGAPMLAPENTMMSFEKAVEFHASGLETDIYLRHYQEAKIYIHVYVINEPWLFSLAWCSSVNSVTTDDMELLHQLSHPLFFMTPGYYAFMWLFLDVTSAVIIAFVFCYHWIKELRRERWLEATASTDIKRINLPKEKSEIQRASQLPNQPPARIGSSPWTPKVHYGSSTRREKKSSTQTVQSVKVPKKNPVPFKNTVKPLTQDFQHSRSSTRETSLKTSEATLKDGEKARPFTEESHFKTHQKTSMWDSSEESYDTLDSVTSNTSYRMLLKKK